MSDIHVEFEQDGGAGFIQSLDPDIADVLVIAGDLGNAVTEPNALRAICRKYAPKPVMFVQGNHSFYGSTLTTVTSEMITVESECSNLTWLNGHGTLNGPSREILGRRFVGCTLWYTNPPHRNWSDFTAIKGRPWTWIPIAARADVKYLTSNMREGDIVITHMLPSYQCVSKRWVDNDCNGFFVNDITDLIIERKPALFCFGHTHDNIDVKIGDTRLVCSPRGYPERQDHQFNPHFVIEI